MYQVTFAASRDGNNGKVPVTLVLGLELETDATGKMAVVVGTVKGGQAERCPGQVIQPGHILVGIGKEPVKGKGFRVAVDALKRGATAVNAQLQKWRAGDTSGRRDTGLVVTFSTEEVKVHTESSTGLQKAQREKRHRERAAAAGAGAGAGTPAGASRRASGTGFSRLGETGAAAGGAAGVGNSKHLTAEQLAGRVELPRDTFEVTFQQCKSLGLELENDFSQRMGGGAVGNQGLSLGAVIKEGGIHAKLPAGKCGKLLEGDILVAVNGTVVLGMQFVEVMAHLKTATWPRKLAFSRSQKECGMVAMTAHK